MDTETFDFTDARNRMVDSQIRPNKVTDPRILSAMRELPRERFLPAASRTRAYFDEDVPLGNGRVLMEPLVIARLVQLLVPGMGERALVVAAGVGYGAALLARCGVRVTALEEDPGLAALAERALVELAPGVSVVVGPLADGWKSEAPYDLVLIEGAVAAIPPAIEAQVRADTGRLVTVRVRTGAMGSAVLAEPTPFGLRARPIFECSTPVLQSLVAKPVFTF
ncbi:MAG: protein-L-isoaspartate O-methyltransferase [Acetobacteraceae bacterium]